MTTHAFGNCVGSGCPVCYPYPDTVRDGAVSLRREERRELFVYCAIGVVVCVPWAVGVVTVFRWLLAWPR